LVAGKNLNPFSISGFCRGGLVGNIHRAIPLLALLVAVSAHAGDTNLDIAPLNLIPENQSLLTESLLWTRDVTIRSGAGYRDNVLLSASNSRGSGFFTSGLDLMFYRLPLDGWEVILFASGDDARYWNDAGTHNEDFWVGNARITRHFNDDWQAGLALQGFYQDQFLDVASGGANFDPTNYLGKGIVIKPGVRRDFSHHLWLQLEGAASRIYYRAPLDDQWRSGGILTAGWDYSSKSALTLDYDSQMEFDDHFPDLDSQGAPLPNTHLNVWRNRVQLADKQYLDDAGHWRATTRLDYDFYRDNGSGYYNFDAYLAAGELRWQAGGWEITGSASIFYLRNPVQTASAASSSLLFRNIIDCTFRIERQLWKKLKVYAQYDLEHGISNDHSGQYNANSSMGGLLWDF
jgi:hypothetical protein